MTLRDDLLKLEKIPGEFFWKKGELEKIKNEINDLIKRTNPDNQIHKKLVELTTYIQNKNLDKANKMINEIRNDIKSIDELKVFNEIENHEGIAAKTQPQKTSFWKKAVLYGMTALTLGIYTPTNANAQQVGVDNGKTVTIIQSGSVGIVNGTPAYTIPQDEVA